MESEFMGEIVMEYEFMGEIVEFMEGLGLSNLDRTRAFMEASGLRFPASGWDRLDCCTACAWLSLQGHILPGYLSSRMLLGPPNPIVVLWSRWESSRVVSASVVSLMDLDG